MSLAKIAWLPSRWLPTLLCAAGLTGCTQVVIEAVRQAQGGAAKAESGNDFKHLGLAYHQFLDANHQPPADWSALETFVQTQDPSTVEALRRLRGQDVAVRWGVALRDADVGTSNYLLAHEKGGPESGGWGLFLDGSVHQLTAGQVRVALDVREGRLPRERAGEIWDPAAAEAAASHPLPPGSNMTAGSASSPDAASQPSSASVLAASPLSSIPAASGSSGAAPLLRYKLQPDQYTGYETTIRLETTDRTETHTAHALYRVAAVHPDSILLVHEGQVSVRFASKGAPSGITPAGRNFSQPPCLSP